jgi:LysM repeat protein
MKLMKIFGMVFALHVALACVVVLIQGCRSTANQPAGNGGAVAGAPPADSENWTTGSASTTDASSPVDPYYPPVAPIASTPLSGLSPAERARTEPTRPTNPGDYISVDVPPALTPPPPAEPITYVIRSGDSFWRIARANNTTIGELQRLNPDVKPDSLRPGMVIKLPGTAPATSATATPAPNFGSGVSSAASTSTYVVRPGDSLSRIAARNGTTVAALREANNLRSDVIQVGQSLLIPGGTAGTPTATYDIAPPAPTGESAEAVTFVVQTGDTLGEIARKFDVTVRDLMDANNITDPKRVRAGTRLVIPGFQAVGTGAIPRPPPSSTTPARPAPREAETPRLPPPGTTTPLPPPTSVPPAQERPPELDALPSDVDAPPVQPLDDPVPAP